MANYWVSAALFRFLLPFILGTTIIFRPSLLSAIYLLLTCYLPFVPVPTEVTMAGHTGVYLKVLVAVSTITTLTQFAFQITLFALPPYAHFLKDCEFLETILRHCGFVRLNDISLNDAFTWISPEPIMLLTSIAFLVLFKKLVMPANDSSIEESNISSPSNEMARKDMEAKARRKVITFFVGVGRYGVLMTLCLAAVLRPSIIGGLYFLVFLSVATWWACNKQLNRGFAIMLCCLAPFVFSHICTLYIYQFQWTQMVLDRNGTYARYFGLTPLRISHCNCTTNDTECPVDPRTITFDEAEWASYINPFAIYWLFYLIVLVSKELLQPDLMRGVSPNWRHSSSKKSAISQDAGTGSVIVDGTRTEDIPLDDLGNTDEAEESYTLVENVVYILETILQLIIKVSYLGTNIIMMAWSITYISWITFVLLIWANLIWLIPNQRKSMLRSSPFLVIYAWFLLLSGYIYSMNLTEEELPSYVQGVNLQEIGFVRVTVLPCNPLLVKVLYTIMFWVTLRQYMQERLIEKQTNTLADMVAPLQVTVGAATTGVTPPEKKKKLLDVIGVWLKKFATKFWIWVVAITLFLVAITGQRMTGFRIVYMALFLIFIISFQLSFTVWRKMMFVFWLVVIVFSMMVLVMTYTYQFDNFSDYWKEYLHVAKEQQLDIGLEKFETKQLFVRLVTPTFFVIITVVQLHYFHKDFMELSDPKKNNIGEEPINDDFLNESSMQGGSVIERSEKEDYTTSSSYRPELSDFDDITFKAVLEKWLKWLHKTLNLVYLFLEIHMPKVVLLFAMLLCVYDKCALYFILILLIPASLTLGRPVQMFTIFSSSILSSLFLLSRMLYQIKYIDPKIWNVTCQTVNETTNTTEKIANNMHWLGFDKTDEVNRSVPSLVKWNIIYILVVTLYSVVVIRQYYHRRARNKTTTRAFFMFPRITRVDADKSLGNMLKYLANYSFFRFGIEITFIATIVVISLRMDMYAVFYSIWLIVLYSLKRGTLAKVWVGYVLFIAVLLPVQYLMAIALPPTLCVEYPWNVNLDNGGKDNFWLRLQEWAFLMNDKNPPNTRKLVGDFMLLLLASRQWVVFRIEKRYSGQNYAGGSNESIIHLAEENDFQNPLPDFISYARSYLDIVKRCIFCSMFYIALAVVFLAGTNRTNLFSVGYLVGAFLFLWEGTDMYLRPIPDIIKKWNWLLGYNVVVICIKVCFQLIGFILIHKLSIDCQYLTIFGIGRLKSSDGASASGKDCEDPMQYLGLFWDTCCFALLIMQKRLFQSFNFFHIVNDSKATTILASRGAELIEDMRVRRMNEQVEEEHRILEKIKIKMDRIKANQQKIEDSLEHMPRRRYKRRVPKTFKQAIRSGDYYMFDDVDDEELDLLPDDKKDEDETDDMPTMGEFLNATFKTDTYTVLRERRKSVRRRSSVPLARKKSARSTMSAPLSAPPTIEEPTSKSVTIKEDPQPSTSKDDDDLSDITEQEELAFFQKCVHWIIFTWALIESGMVSLTHILNGYSRDFRYVLKKLRYERRTLKEKTEYTLGNRTGFKKLWQPSGSFHDLMRQSTKSSSTDEEDGTELSSDGQPPIAKLLLALWYVIMSRSEWLVYFAIFLNQAKRATLLSLPLPLMVFFWGSLTIPRPTKTFWVTIIAYTEVCILIKCLFQLDVIPWNEDIFHSDNPFFAPNIIGIQKRPNYASWDLVLLLAVFFHRMMLKSMGIWKTSTEPIIAGLLVESEYGEAEYRLEDGQLIPVTGSVIGDHPFRTSSPDASKNGTQRQKSIISGGGDADRNDITDPISVQSVEANLYDHIPESIKLGAEKYVESFRLFFHQLLDPTARVAADIYTFMFLCDFFNFFVLLMGFSSFGSQVGDGGFKAYLEENRVPPMFLFMLIMQFTLIIIDRGIYLRRNILGKLMFLFIQSILLHVWLFILFPVITEKEFKSVTPPQVYYIVKCIYFLLSAYQIRCGYPSRILGNCLCKGYSMINMFLFKGFMLVPFLFELRSVMDWMWTETSMGVFDWLKMEDIFAHIFVLKCSRNMEDEYPQPRGTKKGYLVKYLMGTALLIGIIGIIWFPLVFFSLGKAVGEANPPYDVSLELRIGPYDPVYQMSAQSNNIFQFSDANYQNMLNVFKSSKRAEQILSNYDPGDIAAATFSRDSAKIWSISPPDRAKMIAEVNSTKVIKVRLDYKISHKTSSQTDSGIISNNVEIEMEPSTPTKPNKDRINLLKMLQNNVSEPISLNNILPKFLKITNTGVLEPYNGILGVSDPETGEPQSPKSTYRNISLILLRPTDTEVDKEWWNVKEICGDPDDINFLKNLAYSDCNNTLVIYTLNDKIFPQTLSIITGGGIIGLYTTLVLVASRVLRGIFAEQVAKIMFEDLPNVDRVLQLCLDVYLVREAKEFALEEDLFAKLIFLFRSPETMIKWSRPKEELEDDEDPEAS